MSKLSPWYEKGKLKGYFIFCPECKINHRIQTVGNCIDTWEFNENFHEPSFDPSLLVKSSDETDKRRCHSFITDGKIDFCADSYHWTGPKNKEKIIEIPDIGLALIVAMTPNRVIGKDNSMPWPHMREDLKFFYRTTMKHKYMIMGRKTFESIDKVLPGRANMVVSRNPDYADEIKKRYGDDPAPTVINMGDDPLKIAITSAFRMVENPIIIGGAKIYEEVLPQVETMYITKIKKEYDGDTFFPKFDEYEWDERKLGETKFAIFTVWNRKY